MFLGECAANKSTRRKVRVTKIQKYRKMVPPAGLEPARLAAEDFESSASTIPPEGHEDGS